MEADHDVADADAVAVAADIIVVVCLREHFGDQARASTGDCNGNGCSGSEKSYRPQKKYTIHVHTLYNEIDDMHINI